MWGPSAVSTVGLGHGLRGSSLNSFLLRRQVLSPFHDIFQAAIASKFIG